MTSEQAEGLKQPVVEPAAADTTGHFARDPDPGQGSQRLASLAGCVWQGMYSGGVARGGLNHRLRG